MRVRQVGRWRALAVALAVLTAGSLPAARLDLSSAIEIGVTSTLEMPAGGARTFTVDLPEQRPWRLAVEQLGIDVTVEVRDPAGALVAAIDRPLDRDGTEYVLVEPRTPGIFETTVTSANPHVPSGRISIVVDDLSWSSPAERARWLAERAETEAAQAYLQGGGEGLRAALVAYERALEGWRRSGETVREALATYSIAVLHRLLDETAPALEFGQRAIELFGAQAARRWEASAFNEIGLSRLSLGEYAIAREAFEGALAVLAGAPDPFRELMARRNVCLISLFLGELREGIACYGALDPLSQVVGDPAGDAVALASVAHAYDILGEPDRAAAGYERALAVQEAIGDPRGQGLTLNNLAVLHAFQGDHQRALELYTRAADLYRTIERQGDLALALSNIGVSYWHLGETARARSFLEQALTLQRTVGRRRNEAHTLGILGHLVVLEGEDAAARSLYEQALDLRRQVKDRKGEAVALRNLARHDLRSGEGASALERMSEALTMAREVGDKAGEASAELGIGEALVQLGRDREGRARLVDAVAGFRSIGAVSGAAQALTALARAARRQGLVAEAREFVTEAIEAIESMRTQIASPELKATFLASRREAYELDIALWMDQHRAEPGRGLDARALEASERARARALLELLNASYRGGGSEISEGLALVRQRLQYRLDAAERQRARLVSRDHTAEALTAHEAELEGLLAEYDVLEGQIRSADPASSALTRPPILRAPELQALIDPGTVLLTYELGRERSFLWWVTADTIESHELPPQPEIESLSRQVFAELSVLEAGGSGPRGSGARGRAARELSQVVLGPVAERLESQRLIVVADGALHTLPFAALPIPGAENGDLLIARHEIVHLPSASTLAIQRRSLKARRTAPRLAWVVADPVFGIDDPRVSRRPESRLAGVRDRAAPAGPLDRLASTAREAEAIASLGAAASVSVTTGFDATREAVLQGDLGQYQIVHLATHGLINDRSPRLSGLALSQVTSAGEPIDGFLDLSDILDLDLAADLVVLSGCRTAAGREIRGEGLVGLTHGFMFAGARRVLASLWQVQDRATAELMAAFYRALWVDGATPSAALRSAQLALLEERRWRAPYYWAGFVLQGEWR